MQTVSCWLKQDMQVLSSIKDLSLDGHVIWSWIKKMLYTDMFHDPNMRVLIRSLPTKPTISYSPAPASGLWVVWQQLGLVRFTNQFECLQNYCMHSKETHTIDTPLGWKLDFFGLVYHRSYLPITNRRDFRILKSVPRKQLFFFPHTLFRVRTRWILSLFSSISGNQWKS